MWRRREAGQAEAAARGRPREADIRKRLKGLRAPRGICPCSQGAAHAMEKVEQLDMSAGGKHDGEYYH